MMSSAFLTCCSKYRQDPVKIKEFFGTSYIFLIHCASLNLLFFLWCFVYFMDKSLNSNYILKEIYFGSYCGKLSLSIFVFVMWMNGSDLNTRLTGEMVVDTPIATIFALAVPLLCLLCRIFKYLCRYVNQGDKNDGKPFFTSISGAIILMFYCWLWWR